MRLQGMLWVQYSFDVEVDDTLEPADPYDVAERLYAQGELLDVLEGHEIEEALFTDWR